VECAELITSPLTVLYQEGKDLALKQLGVCLAIAAVLWLVIGFALWTLF
jgi:hypothetical protein